MEALTSPKMKIISLKVSETSRATSLGLRPICASACLSQTLAPVTYSIVSTRFDDRGCVISGTCTPAHRGKSSTPSHLPDQLIDLLEETIFFESFTSTRFPCMAGRAQRLYWQKTATDMHKKAQREVGVLSPARQCWVSLRTHRDSAADVRLPRTEVLPAPLCVRRLDAEVQLLHVQPQPDIKKHVPRLTSDNPWHECILIQPLHAFQTSNGCLQDNGGLNHYYCYILETCWEPPAAHWSYKQSFTAHSHLIHV